MRGFSNNNKKTGTTTLTAQQLQTTDRRDLYRPLNLYY